ncbi:MAG: hypothetical protein RIS94_2063 [Pseudomonadota bacterium]|jgi:ATP/maltotriose-dependent transcriptional regulator MalT
MSRRKPMKSTRDPDAPRLLPVHVRPPRPRPGLLPRAHLVDRVARSARDMRLVLVSAPSGFGKTTLLADAYRKVTDEGTPCIWLNITEGANEAAWLGRTLVDQLAALFDVPRQAGEDFASLANRLVADQPVVVFLENWNFIESDAANSLLDRTLAESEGLANFVISSRSVPGFVFEQLRLAGSFAGYTSRDLAFTTEEAISLLGDAGLNTLELFGMVERTEGWPAGVQLLRLALEQAGPDISPHFDFNGSRSDVADYLGKAFFRHIAPERRAFLCNIAVLDELSTDIVACVLDTPQAAEAFRALARDNLFLTEAVDGSGRFRFHSLFRDFLLSQHGAEATIDKSVILDRAATFHAERGEIEPAVHYAVRSCNTDRAMGLLATSTVLLSDEGKVHQYTQWVEALMRQGADPPLPIAHWYNWSLVFGGRWREAMDFARRHGGLDNAEIAATIAAFSDDQPTLRVALDRWRAQADHGGPFQIAVMQGGIVVSHLANGQVDRALDAAEEAAFAIDRTEAVFGRVWVLLLKSLALLMKGRAGLAESTIRDAIRIAELRLGAEAPVARVARLMAAIVAWHGCADAQAITDLQMAEKSRDDHGLPIIIVWASCVASALGLDWGDRRIESDLITPAISLIREAYRVEALLQGPADCAVAADAVRVLDMQIENARARKPDMLQGAWMLRELKIAAQVRLLLIARDADAALALATPALHECERNGRGIAAHHFALLRAAALHDAGKASAALRLLIQATEEAMKHGLFRGFTAERRFIAPLLPALAEAGRRAPIGTPDAWRKLCYILELNAVPSGTDSGDGNPTGRDVEPLTERETTILGFLDRGLSNQEIADRLGITVPTVKWHLHNLFTKIAVRNRSSAVRFARENKII